MALAARDPNIIGRPRSGPNLSGPSKVSSGSRPYSGESDLLSAAPGVMSMLRTSTDMSGVGGFSNDSSQFFNVPLAPSRRGGATSRMSTHSIQSTRSRPVSRPQSRLSLSSGVRRPLSRENIVPQFLPDSMSPTIMDVPFASPLVPRPHSRISRDGRSLSMTHTTETPYRLSTNRSFASLRNSADPSMERPRSPYHRASRVRHSGYRPGSPAMSDMSGTRSKRNSGNMLPPRPNMRSRIPVYRDERNSLPERHARRRSSTLPPAPRPHSFYPHALTEQTQFKHTSSKPSVSSFSTVKRPLSVAASASSDAPSPFSTRTMRDGSSADDFYNSTYAVPASVADWRTSRRAAIPSSPLSYDYTEQFEHESPLESEAGRVPTGRVNQIKTIFEERATAKKPSKQFENPGVLADQKPFEPEPVLVPEPPASPIPQRVHSSGLLAALELQCAPKFDLFATFSDESKGPARSERCREGHDVEDPHREHFVSATRCEKAPQQGPNAVSYAPSETLVLPVAESSLAGVAHSRPATAIASADIGVSNMLQRYTHDSQKKDHGAATKAEASEEVVDKKSHHTRVSSDHQSFKSCRDQSTRTCRSERSFKTCKDPTIRESPIPMHIPHVPTAHIPEPSISSGPLPTSIHHSASSDLARSLPQLPPLEPNRPRKLTRVRTNSVVSSKQLATPSSSTNSLGKYPPLIPVRESSSSTEAQRTQAVAGFLVRLANRNRLSVGSGRSFALPSTKEEPPARNNGISTASNNDQPPQSPHDGKIDPASPSSAEDKVATNRNSIPEKVGGGGATGDFAANHTVTSRISISYDPADIAMLLDTDRSVYGPSTVVVQATSTPSPEVLSPQASRHQPIKAASPGQSATRRRDSQTTTNLVWNGRNSGNSIRESLLQHRFENHANQDDTTTALRLSAYRYPALPDLKELSRENSSANASIRILKNSAFRFPQGEERDISLPADDTKPGQPSEGSVPKRGPAPDHGLPPINFSDMDLFEKLKDILNLPAIQSGDGKSGDVGKVAECDPPRSLSVEEIRRKHLNFLFEHSHLPKTPVPSESAPKRDNVPRRSGSPEDLLAEIDNLTIPTLQGLTQRISELLPSIKARKLFEHDDSMVEEDTIIERTREEINELAPHMKRSSARLRPFPGSPNLVVVEDDIYEGLAGSEKSVLPAEGGGDSAGCTGPIDHGHSGHGIQVAELEGSAPPISHLRSQSLGDQRARPSPECKISARRSLGDILGSPTDSRPWNLDANYPWTESVPAMGIALPAPAPTNAQLHSPSETKKSTLTTPKVMDAATDPAREARPATVGSPTPPVGATTARLDFTHEQRTGHHRSLFGRYRPNSGTPPIFSDPNVNGSSAAPSQARGSDKTHEAGERYPASSLTAPASASLNNIMGEPQSYFSEESDEESAGGIKHKLSHLKTRLAPGGRAQSALETSNSLQDAETEARYFSARRQTFEGTAGMSKHEYRKNKILEVVRSIWQKGGNLLRSLSGRRVKPETGDQGTTFVQPDGRRVVPMRGSRGKAVWSAL